MKILLDECIDRQLAKDITGHEVKTVPQMGWATSRNGELLTLAEKDFEVFITVDRNLSFQQHLPRYNIAVIVRRNVVRHYGSASKSKPQKICTLLPLCPNTVACAMRTKQSGA